MDFINNHDLIVAGTSALIALIIGFIFGNKYRKHFGENFELSATKNWLSKSIEQYTKEKAEKEHYYYENMSLKRENEEVRAIDQRLTEKEASLKKLEEQYQDELKTFFNLKEINRDIQRQDRIDEYEAEIRAEKEAKQAKRSTARQADDALSEYRNESNNIGKEKPKNNI